jgi:hypothetical protein
MITRTTESIAIFIKRFGFSLLIYLKICSISKHADKTIAIQKALFSEKDNGISLRNKNLNREYTAIKHIIDNVVG